MKNLNNKYTLEQFVEYARQVHGDKYIYKKVRYINGKTPVLIICKKHGEFSQRPKDHLCGIGCKECRKDQKKSTKTQEFIEKAKIIHNNKYKYTNTIYVNNKTLVKIICPIHGELEQRPNDHLRGRGCRKCQYDKFSYNTAEFILKSIKIHGNTYNYDKANYVNNRTSVTIICHIHGEFKQRPDSHLCGKGCSKCYSGISKKANRWLGQFNNIKRERRVNAGDNTYIVDGIDRGTNTVYEFWGDFWHGNPKIYKPDELNPITKTTFGYLYKNTQNKIKNLKNAGYKIVSIWEHEWDKQEKSRE